MENAGITELERDDGELVARRVPSALHDVSDTTCTGRAHAVCHTPYKMCCTYSRERSNTVVFSITWY